MNWLTIVNYIHLSKLPTTHLYFLKNLFGNFSCFSSSKNIRLSAKTVCFQIESNTHMSVHNTKVGVTSEWTIRPKPIYGKAWGIVLEVYK